MRFQRALENITQALAPAAVISAQCISINNTTMYPFTSSGPGCTKFTIDGNFAINGKYHGNLDFDWLLSPVTMVVAIDGKVTINDKFMERGPGSSVANVD